MNSSIKVKICGITNPEDAQVAVTAGADAIGFIFFPQSPRFVNPQVARHIISKLPPFILPIGVFVNEAPNLVRDIMETCGLGIVQLHGDETPDYCESLNRPVLKGIRLRDRGSFLAMAEYKGKAQVRGFVVDAFSETAYGGTGKTTDWELAAEAARAAPVVLAGGLTPENVQEATKTVKPYGVDVSSGVELSPGKKDAGKIRAFIQAAKLVTS